MFPQITTLKHAFVIVVSAQGFHLHDFVESGLYPDRVGHTQFLTLQQQP